MSSVLYISPCVQCVIYKFLCPVCYIYVLVSSVLYISPCVQCVIYVRMNDIYEDRFDSSKSPGM